MGNRAALLFAIVLLASSILTSGAPAVNGSLQPGIETEIICSLVQGDFCSLDLGTDGKPHVAFYDAINADLKYAFRNDTGWTIETVDNEGRVGMWLDLALDAENRPHISYSAADETFHCYLKYATWNGSAWKTQTVDRSYGTFSSLALDSQGNPHISYNGVYSLNYASWNGSGWKIETVDRGWSNSSGYAQIGVYTSLALDTLDKPFISYYDELNGDLKQANWNGSAWIVQTVDSDGDVGLYPSLALDSNNNPHIIYCGYYLDPVGLRYAFWNGSAWKKETVQPKTSLGFQLASPSLALDNSDTPHISYIDRYTNSLKYAVKTASWLFNTVGMPPHGGYSNSLALGSNGTIHICHDDYYDHLIMHVAFTQASLDTPVLPPTLPVQSNGSAIQTSAFVFVEPNYIEIGKEVNITMLVEPPPPELIGRYGGLRILITRPDGATENLGPFFTNSEGYARLFYMPQQVGTHVVQLTYAGESFANGTAIYKGASSVPIGLSVQYTGADPNENPFRVVDPGGFVGRVTGMDQTTPLPDASIEAILDGAVVVNVTTDINGCFALTIDRAGTYDVRVSASGYITSVRKQIATRVETVPLDFSLVPSEYASTFEAVWSISVSDGSDVAVDGKNNVIIVSGWENTTVSKLDNNGNQLWTVKKQLLGGWEYPCGVAVDAFDNILVLVTAEGNNSDYMGIAKLDPSGNALWTAMFDSGDSDMAIDVAVDSGNNVVVAGNVQVAGQDPLAVVKYDSDGSLVWSKILQAYMWYGELAIDKDDNVIVCGVAGSDQDGFGYYVAKLAPNGDLLWEQILRREEITYADCYAVDVDVKGNVLVIGNGFTAKLDPSGNESWLRYDAGIDLTLDLKGNIITLVDSSVATYTSGGLFLGGEAISCDPCHLVLDGSGDIIVIGLQNLIKLRCEFHNPVEPDDTPPSDTLNIALAVSPFTFILPLIAVRTRVRSTIHKIKAQFALVKKT